jgi:hypothetical protein
MFRSARASVRKRTVTIVTAMALTTSSLFADASTANAQSSPNKKAMVGSWVETVTFPAEAGRPPLKSLVVFHDDQTLVVSDQGSVTTEPPSVYSSGAGSWKHLHGRTFAYTQLELISDLAGNLVGYLDVRGVYTVSESGNEYTGNSFAQVVDPAGSVLFSVDVTNAGKRIQVEVP